MTTLAAIILGLICSLYRAVVLVSLWAWFIVPQFQVSELPYFIALGLLFMRAFLNGHNIPIRKESPLADGLTMWIHAGLGHLFGYLIHLLVIGVAG